MSAVGFSGAGAFVGTCDFVIAADGAITGACTAHNLEDCFHGSVDGDWKVSPGCEVRGSFASQDDVASDIQARMNRGKDVITGISLDPQTINQFTAVKYKARHRGRRRFADPRT